MPKGTDFYIVVCSGFHGALGVFAGLESALLMAHEANTRKKKGDVCTYVPVPIQSYKPGDFTIKENGKDSGYVGQYL